MPGESLPYIPEESIRRELIPVLLEAAHRAFGPGQTASVQVLADYSGYEVMVQGAIAAELDGCEEAILKALSRELWPLLPDPYVDLTKQMEAMTSSTQGWRLILWRSSEGEATDARRCWSFVKGSYWGPQYGCQRGKACRWVHEIPETFGIGIKVSAVRYSK